MSRPSKRHRQQQQQHSDSSNPNARTYFEKDNTSVSVFYGMSVTLHEFAVLLLRHDKVFADAMLKRIRAEDKEFSRYTLDDVIDDCLENWALENFERTKPSKAKTVQAGDEVEDVVCELARMKSVNPTISTNDVQVTLFPTLEFELHNEAENVYIGKRTFVFLNGTPIDSMVDVVAFVGTQLDELAQNLNTTLSFL